MRIVQFLPYFPPHIGGVETVAQELSFHLAKIGISVINITFDKDQEKKMRDTTILKIKDKKGNSIGYKENGYDVFLLPSFEIIPNYPIPKIRQKQFRTCLKEVKNRNYDILQTHTRFFLSTFLCFICAKVWKKQRILIEHGSGYVSVKSKIVNFFSRCYDICISRILFSQATKRVAISKACKNFMQHFTKKEITIIYRGVILPEISILGEDMKKKFAGKTIIGYIGRLVQWKNVDTLIRARYTLPQDIQEQTQLVIIGDGEEYLRLKKIDTKQKVYFTGKQTFDEAYALQKQFDIHVHSSNQGGGLATTLLQAMKLGCLIVATPNEGANEVIYNMKNGILVKDGSLESILEGMIRGLNAKEKKETWANENKKIIEERFSREKNILSYKKIYEEKLET